MTRNLGPQRFAAAGATLALVLASAAVEAQTSLTNIGGGCTEAACPDAPTATVKAGPKDAQITMTWTPATTGGTVKEWEVLYAETGKEVGGTTVEASRRKQVYASLDLNKTYDIQIRGLGSNGEVGDSAKATGIAPLNDPATRAPLRPLRVTIYGAPEHAVASGHQVSLTASGDGGSGGYTYSWVSDYWAGGRTGDAVSVVVQATGTFTVTVTDDGMRSASASESVTVSEPPPDSGEPPPGDGSPPSGGDDPPSGGDGPPSGGDGPPSGGDGPPSGGDGPPSGGGDPPPGGGDPPPEEDPSLPMAPEAAFSVDAVCVGGLCRVQTGEAVAFTDTSSGNVSRRSWDFHVPANRLPSGAVVRHAWSSPGFYEVTLTVDGAGAESSASRLFLVEAANPAGTCEPDAETSCLQDSRFEVSVEWQASGGEPGAGRVVHAGTNDSGLFSFFDKDNWEVLVKVLDGCRVNGHHWVYAASATSLAFEVTVTDTATGEVYRHSHGPDGVAALADAVAFPGSCHPE